MLKSASGRLLHVRETLTANRHDVWLVFSGTSVIFDWMKRSVLTRMVTALWGVWFVAALIGPATLHACPQHEAVTHASHAGAHAGMDMSGSGHVPAGQNGLEHKCNCLTECCAAAVVAPSQVSVPAAAILVARETGVSHCASVAAVARYEHAQPFSNGPPSRV